MKYFIISLMAAMLLLIGCSKDKPTQSPAPQGTMILSRVSISMVPSGVESVEVWALDKAGQRDTCNIVCDDSEIASASINDSTISITGLAVGTCNITVTSNAGRTRVLPVEVYDPTILDTGELIIKYTSTFNSVFHNIQFGLWKPIPSEGFYALGTCGTRGDSEPQAMMTIKAKPGSDAIEMSAGYDTVVYSIFSLWRPIAPPGYVALGMVATMGQFTPGPMPNTPVACIREDLTMTGVVDTMYIGPGYGFWSIVQPNSGPHPQAYLATGSIIFVNFSTDPPSSDAAMNILKVNLPMLVEAPDQDVTPRLTSLEAPPIETAPRMKKALLAPFSVIKDQSHDAGWQVSNSAVYNLERQVYYKCIYHKYNQTSVPEANEVELVSGISTTETQRIWGEIGVELSAEAGVSIGVFTGKVTATVSVTLGYQQETSINEFTEKHVNNIVNVPPGKASALWQQYNRFTLYRHNGNSLETVGSYEVGIDSYVTDEYPD